MGQPKQQAHGSTKVFKGSGSAKEISSKSQSPHTSAKFQYQQASYMFTNNSNSKSYLSNP